VIDYRKWRHKPVLRHEHEPAVLTPMQRNVFWKIYSGCKLESSAADLAISVRTLKKHKMAIEERIPGLDSFSAYGALGSQILMLFYQVESAVPITYEVSDGRSD
jgi:DNA-binding CsgD family transcriptional regulator